MNATGPATNKGATNRLLRRMLRARRLALRAGAVFAVLLFGLFLDSQLFLLTFRGQRVVWAAIWAAIFVILVGLLITCYYLFRAGLREVGVAYAMGHVLFCIGLSWFFLIGIIAIPLLVRGDIERWRRWRRQVARGCELTTP
jgi:hypothetical protein